MFWQIHCRHTPRPLLFTLLVCWLSFVTIWLSPWNCCVAAYFFLFNGEEDQMCLATWSSLYTDGFAKRCRIILSSSVTIFICAKFKSTVLTHSDDHCVPRKYSFVSEHYQERFQIPQTLQVIFRFGLNIMLNIKPELYTVGQFSTLYNSVPWIFWRSFQYLVKAIAYLLWIQFSKLPFS